MRVRVRDRIWEACNKKEYIQSRKESLDSGFLEAKQLEWQLTVTGAKKAEEPRGHDGTRRSQAGNAVSEHGKMIGQR